jgi:hypothetical protein
VLSLFRYKTIPQKKTNFSLEVAINTSFLMLLLATIIAFLPLQSSVVATRYFRRQEITSPLVDQTYDYVVVGGGTGGSAIAMRLAQNDFKVALIEAGGHYELESHAEIPVMDTSPVGSDPNTQSPIDWGFVTRGQPGANYRPIHYARGKCLGGS